MNSGELNSELLWCELRGRRFANRRLTPVSPSFLKHPDARAETVGAGSTAAEGGKDVIVALAVAGFLFGLVTVYPGGMGDVKMCRMLGQ